MMEVKQNTAVDLNELIVPPKSVDDDGTDELDDAIMTDLTEEASKQDLNCDLSKVKEKSTNDLLVSNGNSSALSPLMDIDDDGDATGLDEDLPVSTEMEDALLAEDDVLPTVNSNKILSTDVVPPTLAEEDLLADKVETSNSTTTSSNDRDPGDDLDTLLSKINDIVDDCLDKDSSSATPAVRVDEDVFKVPQKEKSADDITPEEVKTDTSLIEADSSIICLDDSEEVLEDVKESEGAKKQKDEDSKESKETEIIEDSLLIEETIVDEKTKEISEEAGEEISEKIPEDIQKESAKVPTESTELLGDEIETEKEMEKEKESIIEESIILPEASEQIAEESIISDKGEEKVTAEEDQLISKQEEEDLLMEKEEDSDIQDVPEQNTEKENLEIECSNKKSEEISLEEKSLEKSKEKKEITKPQETEEQKEDIIEKDLIEDNKKEEQQPEESDDEIVFYVDEKQQEEAEKPKIAKEENLKNAIETEKEKQKEKDIPKDINEDKTKNTNTVEDDDDVVILDDDDEVPEEDTDKKSSNVQSPSENEVNQLKRSEDLKNEKETKKQLPDDNEESKKHSTNLDMDNSDNARDDFVTGKVTPVNEQEEGKVTDDSIAPESSKPQDMEETNSNCSSSSNLLLEAKANSNSGDGGGEVNNENDNDNENENENEEDDDDGDVELIENESKEEENGSEKGEELAPPAKRPRLSEDSQVSLNIDETISNRSLKNSESLEEKSEGPQSEGASLSGNSALKRSHDVIELELDDKSNDSKISGTTESLNKKPRTEEKSRELNEIEEKTINKEEKLKEEDTKQLVDDIKMIPSYKPIPLYPPPKLDTLQTEKTFSLDFLKKFRKSFDKMTKQDLEEMVLQKVVEAIIHKSEFAEMRELIEKQEKLIASHRTKITELSKQFRDLEMVHNRVVKDIEQRNSQFIMPVKITRAVGLQVYIPNKKTIMESASTSSPGSGNIISSSPQRPMASSASSQTSLTSPQRPMTSSSSSSAVASASDSQARSIHALTNAVSSAISNAVRRGCAQKITPTRPVPGSSTSSTSSNAIGSTGNTTIYRTNSSSNQSQSSQSQPRILNKNAATSSTVSGGISAAANAANMQRNRFGTSNMDSVRMQQQQQASAARSSSSVASQRLLSQKPTTTPNTVVPRRSDPSATGVGSSNSTSSLDSYMNTLSQLTGGNTAVSITPAKPKEKAVIDLTDEDELTPVSGSNTTTTTTTNGPMGNQTIRRSLPTPNNQNTNSNSQYGRNAPPLARIPPINQVNNSNKNRPVSQQGPKSNNSNSSSYSSTISTPAGTSITRINVSSASAQNSQRVKYSHPAPLPATPPQAFNPAWKLPPPRPTIRISNLDNGIVISWTMEESMDRHAECVTYQIYAYQETSGPPMADSWRHVGDVKAMLLPMAVTLTQFQEGQRYFFAVRAVDFHHRYGPFSLPKTWS